MLQVCRSVVKRLKWGWIFALLATISGLPSCKFGEAVNQRPWILFVRLTTWIKPRALFAGCRVLTYGINHFRHRRDKLTCVWHFTPTLVTTEPHNITKRQRDVRNFQSQPSNFSRLLPRWPQETAVEASAWRNAAHRLHKSTFGAMCENRLSFAMRCGTEERHQSAGEH